MNEKATSRKLNLIAWLLVLNMLVMSLGAIVLVVGLLPKLERIAVSSERVEQRFQSFADDVQPVVSAGSSKAIDAIDRIDVDRLTDTANEQSDELLKKLSEKAMRMLEDQGDE